MSVNTAFCPRNGQTRTATIATAGTAVQVTLAQTNSNQLAITNTSTGVVFVRPQMPNDTVAASALDYPVLPGQVIITINPLVQTISVNSLPSGATGNVYITQGEGL